MGTNVRNQYAVTYAGPQRVLEAETMHDSQREKLREWILGMREG